MKSKEERKKILEEALSPENKEGWNKVGECIGELIRKKLEERRRNYKPQDLKEMTKEILGPLAKKDW